MEKNTLTASRDYSKWISAVCTRFKESQIKAAVKTNSEMIGFYFYLDPEINQQRMRFLLIPTRILPQDSVCPKCIWNGHSTFTIRSYLLYYVHEV